MGSRDTQARKLVYARLLVRVKEATMKKIPRDELENMYPLVAPSANLIL